MPPWVASVPHYTGALRRNGIGRFQSGLKHRSLFRPKLSNLHLRYASAHVSPTAINVQPNIPARNEELYSALSELNKEAEQYVNISRVQLALRNLASQDPVIRIAVLSLGSQLDAQRMARLLLADPLGSRERWEDDLEQSNFQDERPVLLRYGDGHHTHPPSPLYRVLSIPSQILRAHNLEILISTLDVDVSNTLLATTTESSQEALLVPKLLATSARGLPVPYPVHKTLVIGEGLDKAVAFGRFTSDISGETGDMVRVAIDLPLPMEGVEPNKNSTCSAVNIDAGAKALSSFRESVANSVIYERGWFRSGMPGLSQWLTRDLQPTEPIKPAMKIFISSLAEDAEASITKEDTLQLQTLSQSALQQRTSDSTLGHLETWAEQSHTELRDQLDAAFSTRNWHKLSWWKLFWRVDDVSMITSEIIERRWLTDAEKRGVYLAGRMNQAGFPDIVQRLPEPRFTQGTAAQDPKGIPTPSPQQPMDLSTDVQEIKPWHTQISTSRTFLLQTTIPPLQALAQTLVLRTLSTISLASALSALLWVSTPTVSVFEAGAIAALGLVYSLRHMQKVWEEARANWQVEVREEGRKTLKFTEELVRWIVRGCEETVEENEGVVRRKRARDAVERVRDVLRKM